MSETLEPLNPGVEGLHRAEHKDFFKLWFKELYFEVAIRRGDAQRSKVTFA